MIRNTHTSQSALLKGIGATLLGLTLVGCGSNTASDNTSAASTGSSTSSTSSTSPASNTTSTGAPQPTIGTSGGAGAASFKAAAATWTKISAAKADLDKIIASKKLTSVHEAAFKVRDIVRTLPAQSSGLAPDKAKTLATQIKNVDQLASRLDKEGDSNNLKGTQDNQAGLSDTLDTIHDLYPSGTFK